jgi:hypothetical protein
MSGEILWTSEEKPCKNRPNLTKNDTYCYLAPGMAPMEVHFPFYVIHVILLIFPGLLLSLFPHLPFSCRDIASTFCHSIAHKKLRPRADRHPHLSPPNKHCSCIDFQFSISVAEKRQHVLFYEAFEAPNDPTRRGPLFSMFQILVIHCKLKISFRYNAITFELHINFSKLDIHHDDITRLSGHKHENSDPFRATRPGFGSRKDITNIQDAVGRVGRYSNRWRP